MLTVASLGAGGTVMELEAMMLLRNGTKGLANFMVIVVEDWWGKEATVGE